MRPLAESERKYFPNRAGDHPDNDAILRNELENAGIDVHSLDLFRGRGEVVSSIMGTLHGWSFKRAWNYWIAEGPGIPVEDAEKLHAEYGQEVRVAGHCGCPSPGKWFQGLACGLYHVDTQDGLNALAKTIRSLSRDDIRIIRAALVAALKGESK